MSERAVPNCVLVVEDDTEVRAALEELLRMEGFETIGARNGREALAALEEGPLPVLILLDLMMPVMDGWEFRLEQRRRPRLAGLPVVAMSADSSAKAAAIDADCFLRKPYSFPELLAAIQQAMRASDARRVKEARAAEAVVRQLEQPLTEVITNLQELQKRVDAEPAREVVQAALETAERARKLVREAADASPIPER